MKVFILSNDDLTSSLIFAPLFERPDVEVVGLAYTATITRGAGGQVSGALGLLRRMSRRYWFYLVFVNVCFKLFESLTTRLGLVPRLGWLVSLRGLCSGQGVPIDRVANFNAAEFHDVIRRSGAELLVIRVNQILSAETLGLTRHGVWCVHSSLLPSYRGIAAEFHALARGEPQIGTTIFRVEPKLDKGPPLFQMALKTESRQSVFGHMVDNNLAAGRLLAGAVDQLASTGRIEESLIRDRVEPSYYSWPQRSEVRRLKRRGHRLISLGEAVRLFVACLRLRRPPLRGRDDVPMSDVDRRSAA